MKRETLLAVHLFFFLLVGIVCNAQVSSRITGELWDADKKQGIADAEIFIEETGKLFSSDQDGQFEINLDEEFDVINLVIFATGYKVLTMEVNLADDTKIDRITMSKLSATLSTLEVQERRSLLFALRKLQDVEGTSIYAGKKTEVIQMLQLVGNLAANNARQIYAQVAGLNIYENSDAGLQLNIGGRGLDPNRTSNFNTRQNGYDISADVLGYPESYYTPPAEAIEEIQIIKGASSLQYGTQFGGLVNFVLQKPSRKKISFETRQTLGSFGQFTSFNKLSGTIGKSSYQAYYNYKSGDGYRPFSKYDSHNVFAQFSHEFNPHSKLKLEYTYLNYLAQQAGGLSDTQFEQNPRQSLRERNWFNVDWNLFNLTYELAVGEKGLFNISLFGLKAGRDALGFRGDPLNLNDNPITAIDEQDEQGNYLMPRDLIKGDFQNWGFEARYLWNYKLKSVDGKLLVGTKYFDADNSSDQGPGSSGTDADFGFYTGSFLDYPNQSNFKFPNRNLAFFAENVFELSNKWTVTPGVRLENIRTQSEGQYEQLNFDNAGNVISQQTLYDNRDLDRTFLLLGLGIDYDFNTSTELYVNFSQNYRSVTFSDIRVVNPSFIIDPDIVDEEGWTFDIGLRGKWRKYLNYDVGAFYLNYDNRIGIILDDRANRVRTNVGTARILGIEAYGELAILRWLKPEWTKSKLNVFGNVALTNATYTESIVNNVEDREVEFVPDLNLKCGFKYGWKDFFLNLQYTYLSEQFTDAENSERAPIGDSREGLIGPIPAYHIVDLSATYVYKNYSLDVGINNLTDNDYFTRRATGYPGPGIIPADGRSFYVTLGAKF